MSALLSWFGGNINCKEQLVLYLTYKRTTAELYLTHQVSLKQCLRFMTEVV